MAGSVTGLHVFAADVGPEPLSLLDGNFSPLATAINTLSTFSNYYVDSGAVNALAITVNAPQVVASYTDGLQVQVQCANTTTSATPTLAINGLGARTLIHSDGSSLAIGELVAGMRFTAIYDSTLAEFRILSPTFTAVTLNAPTFNATVTINAVAARQSLVVNGAANQYAEQITASSTAGQSFGLQIFAGTNSSDTAINITNQANTARFLRILGDGSGQIGPSSTLGLSWTAAGNETIAAPSSGNTLTVNGVGGGSATIVAQAASGLAPLIQLLQTSNGNWQLYVPASATDFRINNNTTDIFRLTGTTAPTVLGYGPVAAALVDMTPDKGQWTTTLSGPYTVNPTGTVKWERQGTQVTVWCDAAITGTATGSSFITASGVPAAITPSSARQILCWGVVNNGSASQIGMIVVNTNNTFTIYLANTVTGANPQAITNASFTGAGSTGLAAGISFTYSL